VRQGFKVVLEKVGTAKHWLMTGFRVRAGNLLTNASGIGSTRAGQLRAAVSGYAGRRPDILLDFLGDHTRIFRCEIASSWSPGHGTKPGCYQSRSDSCVRVRVSFQQCRSVRFSGSLVMPAFDDPIFAQGRWPMAAMSLLIAWT